MKVSRLLPAAYIEGIKVLEHFGVVEGWRALSIAQQLLTLLPEVGASSRGVSWTHRSHPASGATLPSACPGPCPEGTSFGNLIM